MNTSPNETLVRGADFAERVHRNQQWLATPGAIRRFDGAVLHLSAISLDEELTRRLIYPGPRRAIVIAAPGAVQGHDH
jgi:hypothetical protein